MVISLPHFCFSQLEFYFEIVFFYCFVIFLVSNQAGPDLSVWSLCCACQGIVLVDVLCVRREDHPWHRALFWTPGCHLLSVVLQLSTAVLTKGSTFQVQLWLRWNVPDISVSVQHSHFVHPVTAQSRREECSGRAVNSELS